MNINVASSLIKVLVLRGSELSTSLLAGGVIIY